MNHLSVDELVEMGTRSAPEVFATLSAITATATDEGIAATVNLEGRLVALTLAPHALAAGPGPLAATIYRLVQEASAAALNTGIEVLAPVAGEELAAELRALTLPEPTKARPAADDFSTVESWTVPH
ncbi:hypothetical protein [Actinophytocola glycyrrhizae]|uniref:YbaB/EbfC DNA-binding family protein n=1 Tax=Actinophytocola glycyrrhizae TaxID=2044873 RepID=A0ABV9SDG4_9PSEU